MAGGEPEAERFGFIRLQGNAYTWCQEGKNEYPLKSGDEVVRDEEDSRLLVVSTASRLLRGGSYFSLPANLRSAARNDHVPTIQYTGVGVRVARTIVP